MSKANTKIEKLFNAQAHLGHRTNRVHPKAKKFIYTYQERTSIIDLTKTIDQLDQAKKQIKQLAKDNKRLLVVATKKISSSAITKLCKKHQVLYITLKWPAGLLTNFQTLAKNIEKLKKMEEEKKSGEWNKFTKHEQIKLNRKLNRLQRTYNGIIDLKKIPDLLFVVDIKKEKNAISEAKNLNIPVIGICDTNNNPKLVNLPIPANDDSQNSIQIITEEIVSTYSKYRKTTNND